MNENEQRIAIAEACGWITIHNHEIYEYNFRNTITDKCADKLPDYLSDLNAMYEAEKLVSLNGYDYIVNLIRVVSGDQNMGFGPDGEMEYNEFSIVCPTAAQRAEAFLRTIGKWKE